MGVPELNKGLTGAKVARAMLQTQWSIFGVPSIITSDQGSHFVSAWWQTICAGLGVRCAQAQAYHHATNGRAEVAGQQIIEILRKMSAQNDINWVEALARVWQIIHDNRGKLALPPMRSFLGVLGN